MSMHDKELLFEIVPRGDMKRDIQQLGVLGYVAGLLVYSTVRDGKTFLCVQYSDESCDYKRTRNAGRPRKKGTIQLTCGEVASLKAKEGAKVVAATLDMPIATFYRRYNDNKREKTEEPFV